MVEEIKISVLDDDKDEWHIMQDAFKDFAIEAEYFDRSEKFIEHFRQNHKQAQVLILDYNLGEGVTGLDVMQEIQKTCNLCYFIIITGQINDDTIIEFLNWKADWFIKKNWPGYPGKIARAVLHGVKELEEKKVEQEKKTQQHEELVKKADAINKTFEKMVNRKNHENDDTRTDS